jgi:hypothetical protein
VAQQVHRGVVQSQRVVDRERPALRRFAVLGDVDRGEEPLRDSVRLVAGREVGQLEAEVGQVAGIHPRTERGVVVLRHRVAEAAVGAGDEQPVAVPAVPMAEADAHQHREQREVEQQVAGLFQIALLGRDGPGAVRLFPDGGPVAAPAQHCRGSRDGAGRIAGPRFGVRMLRQAVQPARRVRRYGPQRPEMIDQPWHHAADQ